MARGPCRQPRRLAQLGEIAAGQRCLTEARPALSVAVGGARLRHQARRHQEQDGVVDFRALGEELAGCDHGVGGHVRVDQGAVVVVGGPQGRGGGAVGVGRLQGDRPGRGRGRGRRRRRGTVLGASSGQRCRAGHERDGHGQSRSPPESHQRRLARPSPWPTNLVIGYAPGASRCRWAGSTVSPRGSGRASPGARTAAGTLHACAPGSGSPPPSWPCWPRHARRRRARNVPFRREPNRRRSRRWCVPPRPSTTSARSWA